MILHNAAPAAPKRESHCEERFCDEAIPFMRKRLRQSEIVSQTPLAMTPAKILAINANVAG